MGFMEPAEGTPAYEALLANRQHPVTKTDKYVLRHVRRVKKKHIIGHHKKARRKERTNIKGKVIDGQHEQYIVTMGMMMGIRVSIDRTRADRAVPLLVRDFGKCDKLVFPPGGSKNTPPHQLNHTFKFKDYAPKVFRSIRLMYGVDDESYSRSVCGDFNYIQFIANSRSGQYFFYSHDGKYMIKTQTKEENKFLRRILPHYYRHMAANPDSTICRFYGMHRVKMYHLRRKLHFVVMSSVFDTPRKIHAMYDLKGSLLGREASEKEAQHGGVLKDKDFLRDGFKFELSTGRAQLLKDQMARDSTFLASLKIMDYSLLVGVHDTSKLEEDEAAYLSALPTEPMIQAADALADADIQAAASSETKDGDAGVGASEGLEMTAGAAGPETPVRRMGSASDPNDRRSQSMGRIEMHRQGGLLGGGVGGELVPGTPPGNRSSGQGDDATSHTGRSAFAGGLTRGRGAHRHSDTPLVRAKARGLEDYRRALSQDTKGQPQQTSHFAPHPPAPARRACPP